MQGVIPDPAHSSVSTPPNSPLSMVQLNCTSLEPSSCPPPHPKSTPPIPLSLESCSKASADLPSPPRTHLQRLWKSAPSSTPRAGHTPQGASHHPLAGGTPGARRPPHLPVWPPPPPLAHRACHTEARAELLSPWSPGSLPGQGRREGVSSPGCLAQRPQ